MLLTDPGGLQQWMQLYRTILQNLRLNSKMIIFTMRIRPHSNPSNSMMNTWEIGSSMCIHVTILTRLVFLAAQAG